MFRFGALGLAAAAILTSAMFLATSQASSDYVVTRRDDPSPDSCLANDCSLREAINAANASAGTVVVPEGTVALTQGPISVTGNMTIDGAGADKTVLNSGGQHAFDIAASAGLAIMELKITGGAEDTGCGGGINNAGNLSFMRAEISGNTITGQGGGVCNTGDLQLFEVKISGNAATHNLAGGGVWNGPDGYVGMNDVVISGNTATGTNGGGDAAGVYNEGEMIIENSVISGNTGTSAACDDCSSAAGILNKGTLEVHETSIENNHSDTMAGLENRGQASVTGSAIINNNAGSVFNDREKILTISNTTISGNSGGTYPKVGTAALTNYGSLTLTHVTMANNPNTWIKYGSLQNFGSVFIANAILFNNGTQSDCNTGGLITSYGGNIVDDDTCELSGNGDMVGDPMIGPLQDNGGETLTHALQSGSPAIDNVHIKCMTPDQRGAQRPVGGGCDSGAFEFGGVPPTPTPSPSPTPAPVAFPMGDANCNDRIDSGDISAELRLVTTLDAPDDCGRGSLPCIQSGDGCFPQWTDTDCDGDIDAADAVPVLLHLAGSPETAVGCVPVGAIPSGG